MTLLRYEHAVTPAPVGFPWKSLPSLRADDVGIERDARRAIAELVDFARLHDTLASLFVASLDHVGVSSTKVTSERRDLGARFNLSGEGIAVWLSVEPALVVMLLKRVLGQRDGVDSGAPLSEAMSGAALAVLAEVCRRVARGPALRPDFALHQGPAGKHELVVFPGEQRAWAVDFWVRIDGRSFAGFAAISGALNTPTRGLSLLPSAVFTTPVTLCLVAGRCEIERTDFESLMVGDVLMPSDPGLEALARASTQSPAPNGTSVVLCSPGAVWGLRLCVRDAKLCLAGTTELCYDRSVTIDPKVKAQNPTSANAAESPALDVVMQAPVVVHIEIGSVTLPASQWLGLRLGDVVTSELPVGHPVTLRVAEQAVAEGELVSVDGQVGVRILRFHRV